MKPDKKALTWNFVFQYGYVLTNILNAIILLPLYIHKIDTTTLGLWLATGNVLTWLTMADPGIGDVLQQKVAELSGGDKVEELNKTIGSGLTSLYLIMPVCCLLGGIFYFLLEVLLNQNLDSYQDLRVAFVVSILSTGLSLVYFGISGINQGLHNTFQSAVSSISANLFFLLINTALLFLGFGVVSIAIANLLRALFLCIYNYVAMHQVLKKKCLTAIYDTKHLKKFARLFSYTSLSKIIVGLTSNVDLIILARYIPASLIAIFEINRRPVKIFQSLIGRHSVALMPMISYEKGRNNKQGLLELINKQFKFYFLTLLFCSLLLWINFQTLIDLWLGRDKYAGDLTILLLLSSFFIGTTGYFMSNISYALGDIKFNSVVNIARGVLMSVCSIFMARRFGIIGILSVGLFCEFTMNLLIFSIRIRNLNYLKASVFKGMLKLAFTFIPIAVLMAICVKNVCPISVIEPSSAVAGSIIKSGIFLLVFISLLMVFVKEFKILLSTSFCKFRRRVHSIFENHV